jgi:crotonobetainyl-CoA:carnitine CoA-transferase CaiB-like acyl-CoA transferase
MVRRLVAKGWVLLTAERRKNLQRWSIEAKVVRADKPRWVSA